MATLTPVDDPWGSSAPTLTPVAPDEHLASMPGEGSPLGPLQQMYPPDPSRGYVTPIVSGNEGKSLFGDVVRGMGQVAKQDFIDPAVSFATAPGDILSGKLTPDDPRFANSAMQGAAMLTGSRLPFAEEGALGTGGGKIMAYHGSPHDFDQFDISKIGTGEGNQAYGHGLYFAEKEGTAQAYRDALGKPTVQIGNQKFVPQPGTPEDIALAHLEDAHAAQSSAPWAYASRSLGVAAQDASPTQKPLFDAARTVLGDWQEMGAQPTTGGHMYQVGINANPEHFLDWDKPLSQQSPYVQTAIMNHPDIKSITLADHYGYSPSEFAALPEDRKSALFAGMPAGAFDQYMKNNYTRGSYAYEDIGRNLIDLHGVSSPTGGRYDANVASQLAAQALRESGVSGIKYWDAGSRSAGNGSRNYVVFDDKNIDILKKYGLAGLGLGSAGLAGIPTSGQPQPQ